MSRFFRQDPFGIHRDVPPAVHPSEIPPDVWLKSFFRIQDNRTTPVLSDKHDPVPGRIPVLNFPLVNGGHPILRAPDPLSGRAA